MIGHSIGEYVAACLSGVLSLNDALRLVIRRGELISRVEKGGMLSINISIERLNELLNSNKDIDLAAINSKLSVVVSGEDDKIEEFHHLVQNLGYQSKKVLTSHAFHSKMMNGMLRQFEQEFSSISVKEPQIPYISNVTGEPVTYKQIKHPSYWSEHLRGTVQFMKGTELILNKGNAIIIEIGPGKTLSNYVGESELITKGHQIINTIRHPKQKVNDRKYLIEKLGFMWLNGVNISWDNYYINEKRNRISLPTYSFDPMPYTADFDINKLFGGLLNGNSPTIDTSIEKAIHVSKWEQSILPNDAKELKEIKYSFLIFSDKEGFSSNLANYLLSFGQNVILVNQGHSIKQTGTDFELNYEELNEIEELWRRLAQSGIIINNIIYCAALKGFSGTVNYEDIDESLNKGYLGLSYIAKSIVNAKQKQKINLTIINNHLAKVTEEDEINPLKAAIHGSAQIIPSEVLNVTCKVIDIPYPFQNEQDMKLYLPKIINEILYLSTDPFVAYRFKESWVESFKVLEENEKVGSGIKIIKSGVYIIVGGLGGMGFTIANDLVHRNGANVILIYRSFFPKRKNWNNWLTEKGEKDPISQKIHQVLNMESVGSWVKLYQVDVSDEEQIRKCLLDIKRENLKVNGLIWAAGEVDSGGIIQKREKKDFIKFLTSKIHGIILFEKYLKFNTLDFVSLFSSIGNVFYQQKFGQVAYNAANEFLESFSNYIRKKYRIHSFTINWCDWLDVGMTVKARVRNHSNEDIRLINSGIADGIYPSEGVEVFHKCIQSKASRLTIYKGNLLEAINLNREDFEKEKGKLVSNSDQKERKNDDKTDLENDIIEIFSRFFGIDDISVNDDFFELGGDSLKAMTLLAQINQALGVNLSIVDIYKNPTIKELQIELVKHTFGDSYTISKATQKEYYPLSPAQKRMYIVQMLDVHSTAYNEVKSFRVLGKLDNNKVEEIFNQLICRHEILRTFFVLHYGIPMQSILDEFTFNIDYFKCEENNINELVKTFIKPFDLSNAPLLRAGIVEIGTNEHIIMIDMHHIINDITSSRIFIKEFIELYKGEDLPSLIIQYKDYSEWLQEDKQQEQKINQREFWLNQFYEELAVLDLPTDHPRPLAKNNKGNQADFKLDVNETNGLKLIAKSADASLFMVILSVYNILLSKLSNQDDITVGTVSAGRQHAYLENIMGMFVNTIPLRNKTNANLNFKEYLSEVKTNTLKCFEHQAFPYEELIEELKIVRETNRNPLFDTMFSYVNFDESEFEIPGLSLKPLSTEHVVPKFDLTLTAHEKDEIILCDFKYSTSLFTKESIDRFIQYFKRIVSTIVGDENKKIFQIDILSLNEKHQLLYEFNDTQFAYSKEKTVVDLFKQQVQKTPDKVALVSGDKNLNYKELDQLSNALSVQLKKIANPSELVAIYFEPSCKMVLSILAILKTGVGFVPIDTKIPKDRKENIVNESGCSILLTSKYLSQDFEFKGRIIDVNEQTINGQKLDFIDKPHTNDILYTIFTSGSTGKPKGVMITHHNLINYYKWAADAVKAGNNDKYLLTSNYSCDAGYQQIFTSLLSGGELHLVPRDEYLSPASLLKYIYSCKISVLKMTPSLLNSLVNDQSFDTLVFKSIKYLVVGGEPINVKDLKLVKKMYGSLNVINHYGPTETTIGSVIQLISNESLEAFIERPTIGRPIYNTRCYILDKHNNVQAIGSKGELCISGDGVGLGYLNNEELTKEKFVQDPFYPKSRMYRTGDLARWLADGKIEFLGRLDHQVKIRGYRIELGEIEKQLVNHNQIKEVVVLARERGNDKFIVTYYISEEKIGVSELRGFLSQKLPDYMIPSYFVQLETMPFTPNGKVDRKALPDFLIDERKDIVTSSNDIEEKLASIFSEILELKKESICMTDSFFDIGGHSLKAIKLQYKLEKEFNAKIPLDFLFKSSSIRELGKVISLLKIKSRKNHKIDGIII
jgi:amino acid adenylation domain-containing protein